MNPDHDIQLNKNHYKFVFCLNKNKDLKLIKLLIRDSKLKF
jgi:hypothetical protein